jgi:hypothetical protein
MFFFYKSFCHHYDGTLFSFPKVAHRATNWAVRPLPRPYRFFYPMRAFCRWLASSGHSRFAAANFAAADFPRAASFCAHLFPCPPLSVMGDSKHDHSTQ